MYTATFCKTPAEDSVGTEWSFVKITWNAGPVIGAEWIFSPREISKNERPAVMIAPRKTDIPDQRAAKRCLVTKIKAGKKRVGWREPLNPKSEIANPKLLGVPPLENIRELRNLLLHDLSALEFDRGTGRDYELASRHVWVPSHPRLRQLHLKNSEIAQFHRVAICKAGGDMVKGPLYDIENLVLHQSGFIADFYNEVSLR